MIDNDFHPDDKLDNNADQGHWGTKLAGTFSSFPPLKDTAPLKEGETRPPQKPEPIRAPMKPK